MSEFYLNSRSNIADSSAKSNQVPDYIRIIITTDSHGRKRQLMIPAALDLDRPKRARTTFQQFQIEAMEQEFQQNPFINDDRRAALAESLGITETQVRTWFQNRRTKARKME